jgi:thiol-disulfide isomerase/thioredoxin
MRFPRHRLPGASRLAVLTFVLVTVCAGLSRAAEAGDDAPKFANPDLKGNYVLSTAIFGKKWAIVNFFATWCVPCKEELPALEALQLEVGPEKVRVVVFATDKEKDKVKEFFEQKPTNLTILLDPYQVTYLRYNASEDGLPTIFLISPEGKVAMKHVGYSADFIKELRAKILAAR